MHLIAVGLSHHTAPVEVRERIAVPVSRARETLHDALRVSGVREAVLLSTCNRTEAYARTDGPDAEPLARFLCQGPVTDDLRGHLYTHRDAAAIHHLFRVASGADSMVVGEGQVLGQVREAARLAAEESASGPIMRRLFDHAIRCGRRVRAETGIARGAVSVSHVAVELARRIFGRLEGHTVLLLGAGETAEMTARQLARYGTALVMVANRTFERAEALASALGGTAVKYDDFPDRMTKADMVVSSTAAPHTVISREIVRQTVVRRKGRPTFLIDLAVPRDIDPAAGELDNVFLYNMDDLQALVGANRQERARALECVEEIIGCEVAAFQQWHVSRGALPVMNGLRRRFEEIRREEWARTEARLANLPPAEREAVERMTRAMVKKMLHAPSHYLRGRGGDPEAASAIQALSDLFALEPEMGPQDDRDDADALGATPRLEGA